ncbi:MAG: outer membrane protein assembly factor BamD [Phycisphaerae bacterium]|nr:outer membrane protein assembly factor BamD [Phycisphaerae bacterium]
MLKYKTQLIMLLVVTGLLGSSIFSAETWRLGDEGQWKTISAEDKYLLAVAEIKKLVNMGETKEVRKAVVKLKQDFPEAAGPDLDAFMKAEMLYSRGKFTKAVWSYDKFLDEFPTSGLYAAALDRKFAIATAYFGGQKKTVLGVFKIKGYAEGIKIMEKISDQAGDAPIGVNAAVAVAQCHERRGKFNDAYHKWSEISSRWPSGEPGKDALLSMARCKFSGYKGPKYDGTGLVSARSYYEDFKLRYPEDAAKADVDETVNEINERIAYKEFSTGEYYRKTGNEQSAKLYYQMVVNGWPGSDAAGMAKNAMMNEGKSGAKKESKWKENITNKLEKLLL